MAPTTSTLLLRVLDGNIEAALETVPAGVMVDAMDDGPVDSGGERRAGGRRLHGTLLGTGLMSGAESAQSIINPKLGLRPGGYDKHAQLNHDAAMPMYEQLL